MRALDKQKNDFTIIIHLGYEMGIGGAFYPACLSFVNLSKPMYGATGSAHILLNRMPLHN